jgi:hypothetical protein
MSFAALEGLRAVFSPEVKRAGSSRKMAVPFTGGSHCGLGQADELHALIGQQ